MTNKFFKAALLAIMVTVPFVTVSAKKMKAVDLGLSIKWAPCNVGASSPEEYGDYFAWGEIAPKAEYSWKTLRFCGDAGGNSFSKYNTKEHYGPVDNLLELELADDAARKNLKGKWRTPTREEWAELREKCEWEWTELNGVKGYKVTGPSGKSIFLPCAGIMSNTSPVNAGVRGVYWTASLYPSSPSSAYEFNFGSGGIYTDEESYRSYGLTIRAVSTK